MSELLLYLCVSLAYVTPCTFVCGLIKLHIHALVSRHAAQLYVCVFTFQGRRTAHGVESSSPWFHYAMLITANARHFSFTTGLVGVEPSPNSSVTVQTWNHSVYEADRVFFFLRLELKILLRQSSFDREIWGISFVDVDGGGYTDSIANTKFVSSP